MITDIFEKNIIKILTMFSISPGSRFTRNEIKEKIMLNNIPLDNALSILLRNKILIKERRFLGLNFGNKYLDNLLDIIKKEYLRFREVELKIYYLILDVSFVLSNIKNLDIYLFGSYAKLIYTEKSDVDLAIFLEEEDKKVIKKIKKDLDKIERKCNKNIELHFFEKKDMKEKDPMIREILKNGILI